MCLDRSNEDEMPLGEREDCWREAEPEVECEEEVWF
jgi:hypothetical protein